MPKFRELDIPGVFLIEPDVFRDERGFFLETYHRGKYEDVGIDTDFAQDNHSQSERGVLRGLHAQVLHAQAKLVRVPAGEVFDRSGRYPQRLAAFRTVGRGDAFGDEPGTALHAPRICPRVLRSLGSAPTSSTNAASSTTPRDEIAVAWNDPAIGIAWPSQSPILSDKDREAPNLADITRLPVYGESP